MQIFINVYGKQNRLWSLSVVVFIGFGIAITSSFLQILKHLSRRKQEKIKSRNQDLKTASALVTSSKKMELEPEI